MPKSITQKSQETIHTNITVWICSSRTFRPKSAVEWEMAINLSNYRLFMTKGIQPDTRLQLFQ